jgi:hypothetical protein
MKKATYYIDGGETNRQFFVINENEDGTVDLGTDEKTVVVSKCPVSESPKLGHCVVEGGLSGKAKVKADEAKHDAPERSFHAPHALPDSPTGGKPKPRVGM